ncbi:hypothetical protein QBC34DRAFT_50290 [Podospora aff. communis PSN243]|uniref:Uncharacterized protein n=1 Tax=Podospora aff. communis PSN243 TaxID=3040156 RepID=A0AAV9GV92_9PEZI|nr:hypothetical protein QBC34DRAFT_50290 [Podospora aff. communis PSN243]
MVKFVSSVEMRCIDPCTCVFLFRLLVVDLGGRPPGWQATLGEAKRSSKQLQRASRVTSLHRNHTKMHVGQTRAQTGKELWPTSETLETGGFLIRSAIPLSYILGPGDSAWQREDTHPISSPGNKCMWRLLLPRRTSKQNLPKQPSKVPFKRQISSSCSDIRTQPLLFVPSASPSSLGHGLAFSVTSHRNHCKLAAAVMAPRCSH